MSLSSPTSATTTSAASSSIGGGSKKTWQEKLQEHCHAAKIQPPVFNIVSDRRGGRTAWSSTVTVQGKSIQARYWYDGAYVNNAKEDAAEVALGQLFGGSYEPSSASRRW
ncbi:MAG: hypothetical protein M1834_003913 [Cirrosporium novae-zelandiae]|nr:MAG: hypothetical protein M1834_003913 [Cirrosporium novae-zelandiae]